MGLHALATCNDSSTFSSLFRINSVKSLHTISVALGVERMRNELLPYILDLMDDDEEILVEMA